MLCVDHLDAGSLHLALNFMSNEEEEVYDRFWDHPRMHEWTRGECIPIKWTLLIVNHRYLLLGAVHTFQLWQVGNVTVNGPRHLELERAVGETGRILYWRWWRSKCPLWAGQTYLCTCSVNGTSGWAQNSGQCGSKLWKDWWRRLILVYYPGTAGDHGQQECFIICGHIWSPQHCKGGHRQQATCEGEQG